MIFIDSRGKGLRMWWAIALLFQQQVERVPLPYKEMHAWAKCASSKAQEYSAQPETAEAVAKAAAYACPNEFTLYSSKMVLWALANGADEREAEQAAEETRRDYIGRLAAKVMEARAQR